MTMQQLVAVFVGGGFGSLCRYGLSSWIGQSDSYLPWPTLLANVAACLLLGVLLRYQLDQKVSTTLWLMLATGFCGGFSTFSTFGAELMQYLQQDALAVALVYVAVSLIVGVLAVFAGFWLAIFFI